MPPPVQGCMAWVLRLATCQALPSGPPGKGELFPTNVGNGKASPTFM